jgi:putative nucleotidyltransferase with HDIG domain
VTGYRASRAVRGWQYALALLVVAIAVIGLAGWAAGVRVFAGQFGTYRAMVPVTALCLIALASALLIRLVASECGAVGRVAAAVVIAAVALDLTDALTGLHVAPDRLFATAAELTGAQQVGRISPVVSVCLALLSVALLLSDSAEPVRRSIAHLLALGVGNLGFVLCVGYAYNAPMLYSVLASPPALPSSITLALLGLAIGLLTADRLPLAVFQGDSVRAQLMRAVLPTVVGATVAFALLDVVDIRMDIAQGPVVASAIFFLSIGVVSLTVLRSASKVGARVDRADEALHEAIEDLAASNSALEKMVHDVVTAMGRVVEARDPYTQGHEQRVAAIARLIAVDLGLPALVVEGVWMAGLLHDIGKLHVPVEILTKPGKLSAIEFDLIKQHPIHGFEILKDIAFPWQIPEAVLQHHERADGSGYPRGLRGDEILRSARILAVADVVEAMASNRPYRAALGLEAAIAEIKAHSERYDPEVVASCIGLYERGELVYGQSWGGNTQQTVTEQLESRHDASTIGFDLAAAPLEEALA